LTGPSISKNSPRCWRRLVWPGGGLAISSAYKRAVHIDQNTTDDWLIHSIQPMTYTQRGSYCFWLWKPLWAQTLQTSSSPMNSLINTLTPGGEKLVAEKERKVSGDQSKARSYNSYIPGNTNTAAHGVKREELRRQLRGTRKKHTALPPPSDVRGGACIL